MKLIGLVGPIGSGKDTVGDLLWETYGFLRTAFADPVRLAASAIYGVELPYFIDRDKKDSVIPYWGLTPRQMLRILGEGVKAEGGQDTMVRRWLMTAQIFRSTDHIVVTDVRFPLEAQAVRQVGGTLVHLTRPGLKHSPELLSHISEQGLEFRPGDLRLSNDGTIAELLVKLDVILSQIEDN